MADVLPAGAALGLLETHGLVAAIEAADAMMKASAVQLVRQERTVPALITHLIVGDTAAVQSAIDAGAAAAARVGRVAAAHVIPSPSRDVWRVLVGAEPGEALPERRRPVPRATPAAVPTSARSAADDDYEDRTVRELRSLARDRDDERLQGRAIASATKDELVDFLRTSDAGSDGGSE